MVVESHVDSPPLPHTIHSFFIPFQHNGSQGTLAIFPRTFTTPSIQDGHLPPSAPSPPHICVLLCGCGNSHTSTYLDTL